MVRLDLTEQQFKVVAAALKSYGIEMRGYKPGLIADQIYAEMHEGM